MPQPINYMLNVPNPTDNMLQALKIGTAVQQIHAQQAAQAQQTQLTADIQKLGSNPTPQQVADLAVKYPSISDKFKTSYDMLSKEQQKSHIATATNVYAALLQGKPDIARQILDERAQAATNSGNDKEAGDLTTLSKLIEASPETAKMSTGLFLASSMGPDQFSNTFKAVNPSTSGIMQPLSPELQQAVKNDLVDPKSITAKNQPMWEQLAKNGMLTNEGKIPSQAVVDAAQRGDIDPTKLNSRNIAIFNRLYKGVPGLSVTGAAADIRVKTKMLENLGVRAGNVTTNIKVLDKNMPMLYDLADKVNTADNRIVDSGWLKVTSRFSNDPNVARYISVIKTLRSEYAKLLANGGVPTVEDKKEATGAIPIGLSSGAYRALGDQLDKEGSNIIGVLNDVKKSIKFGNPKGNIIENPESENTVTVNGIVHKIPPGTSKEDRQGYIEYLKTHPNG